MRRRALALVASLAFLWACGGSVRGSPGDAGSDGSSSSSSSGGSSSSGASSGGGSGSSGGGSSGGSSGGSIRRVPVNHRANDAQCSTTPPPGDCNFGGSSGGGFMCNTDAQCADAGANARCIPFSAGPAGCACTYDACFHDNDCTGDTCACHGSPYMGGGGNRCVPGNCHVDADCGPGGYCSPSYGSQNCGGLAGYYCHTTIDDCIDDSDCNGGSNGPQVCAYSTTAGRWECQQEVLCQ